MKLGLDIGGTKIEAVVLDDRGAICYRERYATQKQSYASFFQSVVEIIRHAQAAFPAPLTVGIGVPGAVDPTSGLIKNSNILVLNQQPFASELAQTLAIPVTITNDANCFTLSEAMDGSGQGYGVVFGVILGTGCGGGLCVDQRLMTGPNACAGEWGHNALPRYDANVDGESALCYCGHHNCIESFISGSGLERQYHNKFNKHAAVPEIITQIDAGDEQVSGLWQRHGDQLARALASIINMIDPDVIVLGGGVSNIDRLYTGLQQRVANYVFGRQCNTPILRASHGDSSGVRGAAWLGAASSKVLTTSNE